MSSTRRWAARGAVWGLPRLALQGRVPQGTRGDALSSWPSVRCHLPPRP